MKNKNLILIIVLLIFSFSLSASSQFDAEYLEKNVLYKLNSDGSSYLEYHSRLKLHTYRAANRLFGESFVKYNPVFQKLEILISETTMKDGKKVKSPKNAFNEVLPSRAKKFPVFAGLKEMVITHVGIERGAVIEFKYRLHTKAGFNPCFSGMEYLSELFPVNKLKINVVVLENSKLKVYLNKNKSLLQKKQKDKNIEYSLSLNSIKPYLGEPKDNNISRNYLVFSDADNWNDLFPRKYNIRNLPEELKDSVNDIMGLPTGILEIIFKIQEMMVKDIDLCRLDHVLTGNKIRKMKDVYISNYATSLEKVYLLSGILNSIGLGNEIVFLSKIGDFNKNIPALSTIKAFYLKIPKFNKNKPLYLDLIHIQNGTVPRVLKNEMIYNIKTGKIEKLEKSDGCKNLVRVFGDISLKGKFYKGKIFVELSGVHFDYKASLKGKKKFLKRKLSSFFNVSKILNINLINYSEKGIRAEVELEGKILKELNKNYLVLRDFGFNQRYRRDFFLKTRVSPLVLKSAYSIDVNLNIKYPENMELDYIIKNEKLENKRGVYVNEISKKSKGLINLIYTRSIKKATINQEEYSELKKIIDKCLQKKNLLIFKNK